MNEPWSKRIGRLLLGRERDPHSPSVFHKLSLIALFAWVGLGSDGLSSSCYGPAEAFLALGKYPHFSILIAVATVLTVLLISASYMQVIEMFPSGGGGYLVASKLLSPKFGVISGCALLIDYVLTIAISVASGSDAVFSFLPVEWQPYRLQFAAVVVVLLIGMNMRGVKESVVPLVPIFMMFLVTHVFLIGYAVFVNLGKIGTIPAGLSAEMATGRSELGMMGLMILLLRAYTMGAGTYTGIEAVCNGMSILREPKVRTAKTTMRYMAGSLAFMVFGLMFVYLICGVQHEPGRTLNASLVHVVVADWPPWLGRGFVWVTLFSEAALLFVAAQTGFFGGPSVLATMARDRWVPARFALLSNRLVVQNGIILIGAAGLVTLLLTRGSVHLLVVLYSINVFIDFTLCQAGVVRHWLGVAMPWQRRASKLFFSGMGLLLTLLILLSLVALKFFEGGWITLLTTFGLVVLVHFVKKEYLETRASLSRLDSLVEVADLSAMQPRERPAVARKGPERTAVVLVNGYGGIGLHSVFAIIRLFQEMFTRFVFVQIGVIDAASFKGIEEIEALKAHANAEVERYATLMRQHGYEAEGMSVSGLDVTEEIGKLAPALSKRFPGAVFFGGQLVFKNDSLVTRMLHNFTIFDIQRKLYQQGIQFIILPIRV
jgi:amino acid transporter